MNAQKTKMTAGVLQRVDTAFTHAIESIMKSFPDSFSSVKGPVIYGDWSFRTKVNVPGSIEQSIDYFTKEIRFSVSFGSKPTQKEAFELYKTIYKKLAACQFKNIVAGKTIKLKGSSPPVD